MAHFKAQLKKIGFAYDWQREVNTTDPGYFKWTQWIFLKLYNAWFNPATNKAEPISTYTGDDPDHVRLAYVHEAPVNWCPELGTVLANEEVIDGKSEVGGFPVERRPMRQWMLRITTYAQRLIDELDGLDWPESIKLLQRNWIGRSEGAEVQFGIAHSEPSPSERLAANGVRSALRRLHPEEKITVFTTRPDTLFGATYMVLAPEHPLVEAIVTEEQWPAVEEYREKTARKSDLERTELAKEKSGVFTGAYAINPVNDERIPIWIADYVLLGYGTGAIMAVPAHDERDFEFATKFGLEIREVVSPPGSACGSRAVCGGPPQTPDDVAMESMSPEPPGGPPDGARGPRALPSTEDGFAINSPLIDGLPTAEAKQKITAWLEESGLGRGTINYKLRDWLFSRQRYWGEPFPIVWESGPDGHLKHRPLDESELPLTPPELADFKPTGTGKPPLAKATDWLRYSDKATRETNTMPQWAGSCWYYLRYCDPKNDERFIGKEAESYWMGGVNDEARMTNDEGMTKSKSSDNSSFGIRHSSFPSKPGGVDLYVGGTEHAVLHLLYARFWHKVLFDLGHLSTPEPFQRLVNQGIILGEDGQKMSKSRGNVVNPDDVIAQYGADSFRLYEMFMGPLEQMKPWSMTGVEGVSRFLARVWRLVMEEQQDGSWALSPAVQDVEPDKAQLKVIHATIKKVGEDIETLSFNTAIAQMMIFVNAFTNANPRPKSAIRTLLQLLNPFAPHLTEELWEEMRNGERETGNKQPDSSFILHPSSLLSSQPWPGYDGQYLIEDEVEIVLQVNGKVRDKLVVKKDAPSSEIEAAALASPKIQEHTSSKVVRKVVVVPGKLVNIVAT